MVYILKGPISTDGCLLCCWRANPTNNCFDKLNMILSALGNVTVAVDFAGRGKVGGYCGGSDSYVTFTDQGTPSVDVEIDIWQAYIDGVWSSSTTVLLYVVATDTTNSGTTAYPLWSADPECGAGDTSSHDIDTGVCPATSNGTLTITDTGALTLT